MTPEKKGVLGLVPGQRAMFGYTANDLGLLILCRVSMDISASITVEGNPGSNPCCGRMRYAPTNFGEIIVEYNANNDPVPGLDCARPSEKILAYPLIPYPERSRGESWFNPDLGPSSYPFHPGSKYIPQQSLFLLLDMNIRLREWYFDSCFVQVFFTLDDQLFLHGPEVFVGGCDTDREINGTIS